MTAIYRNAARYPNQSPRATEMRSTRLSQNETSTVHNLLGIGSLKNWALMIKQLSQIAMVKNLAEQSWMGQSIFSQVFIM
jgi:hypothetical protein